MERTALEKYEWDNVWWECAEDDARPRVLYIGDSISCALRHAATHLSEESILFDGFGTSKALDNPYLFESIRLFARQERKRELILLNNGLHGFHLSDDEQYPKAYEAMVRFLRDDFPDTRLALLLTTSAEGDADGRVRARNEQVLNIAGRYSLPMIDLYTPSRAISDLHSDAVHFTPDGSEQLARILLEEVRKLLP